MNDIELTPEYLAAFNNGYLLQKELPELAAKLVAVKGTSTQLLGLRDGANEMRKEIEKEKYPEWLRSDRLEKYNQDIDLDKERDRDMEDPEREY